MSDYTHTHIHQRPIKSLRLIDSQIHFIFRSRFQFPISTWSIFFSPFFVRLNRTALFVTFGRIAWQAALLVALKFADIHFNRPFHFNCISSHSFTFCVAHDQLRSDDLEQIITFDYTPSYASILTAFFNVGPKQIAQATVCTSVFTITTSNKKKNALFSDVIVYFGYLPLQNKSSVNIFTANSSMWPTMNVVRLEPI